MNQKKTKVFLPLLLGTSMAVGLFLGFNMKSREGENIFWGSSKPNTLQEILELISSKYVDEKKTDSIGISVIPRLLEQLDPHSAYISPDEMMATSDDIAGSFCGIGIEYYSFRDTLFVTKVIKDGPAYQAGLKIADKIIGVNDRSYHFNSLSNDSLYKILRGPCGSKLKLKVDRAGKGIPLLIVRKEIPDNSINEAIMTDSKTGYIKIEKFTARTHAEFMEKLMELKNKGMRQLVLDLRGNGGGVLSEATEIADEFLDGDKLITYTEGKHRTKKEFRCRRLGQFEKGNLIVLCDRETASASEILMGALQDWDRATIVGERSFGKGLVQEIFDLSNGGALKLTVSRYYTPLGRCIQRSYNEGIDAYYESLVNRKNDQPTSDSSQVFTTPKGKKLYANNGIKPDINAINPADSMTSIVEEMITKGTINHYSHELAVTIYKNIDTSKQKAVETLAQFNISNEGWKRLIELANASGINLQTLTNTEKSTLAAWIKSLVSSYVWGDSQTAEMRLKEDSVFKKSREMLESQ